MFCVRTYLAIQVESRSIGEVGPLVWESSNDWAHPETPVKAKPLDVSIGEMLASVLKKYISTPVTRKTQHHDPLRQISPEATTSGYGKRSIPWDRKN